VRGWQADGREVELTPQQESQVRALIATGHNPAADEAWSAVLHTAARYDRLRRGENEVACERA
jgi:hypothetical protein